jgi:hypothetical protein
MKALVLVAAVALAPSLLKACEPDAEQMGDYFARTEASERAYVAKLAEEADEIFVGKVIDIEDVENGQYTQRTVIRVEKMIKGAPSRTKRVLMSRRQVSSKPGDEKGAPLESVVSCTDIPDPAAPDPQVIKRTHALFYVKSGALARARDFPYGPAHITPQAEADMVQQVVLSARQ